MSSNTTERIIELIAAIPPGKVASYSQIAALAGLTNGARRVARVLHSCSRKHDLPWYRVLRANGQIALPPEAGGYEQQSRLLAEGVAVSPAFTVNLSIYGWDGDSYGGNNA